jgi:hypothetical protein
MVASAARPAGAQVSSTPASISWQDQLPPGGYFGGTKPPSPPLAEGPGGVIAIEERFLPPENRLVVVRPDGSVAWSIDSTTQQFDSFAVFDAAVQSKRMHSYHSVTSTRDNW